MKQDKPNKPEPNKEALAVLEKARADRKAGRRPERKPTK
jgi:hypothetical protein